MDSSISRRSKCQPSQETYKDTGLTWAALPGNNSFSPSFSFSLLFLAREVLNVTVHPLPPTTNTNTQQSFSPHPAQPPTFPLHMLMLQSHSVGGFVTGGGRGPRALRGSCMHFAKLTPRWLPDSSLFYSLLLFLLSYSVSPRTSYWIKEQKEELLLFISEAFCCEVWRLSLNKWLMDLMHLDSIFTVSSLPQWLTGLCVHCP